MTTSMLMEERCRREMKIPVCFLSLKEEGKLCCWSRFYRLVFVNNARCSRHRLIVWFTPITDDEIFTVDTVKALCSVGGCRLQGLCGTLRAGKDEYGSD